MHWFCRIYGHIRRIYTVLANPIHTTALKAPEHVHTNMLPSQAVLQSWTAHDQRVCVCCEPPTRKQLNAPLFLKHAVGIGVLVQVPTLLQVVSANA